MTLLPGACARLAVRPTIVTTDQPRGADVPRPPPEAPPTIA
jgi:hypothetical protein